MTEPLQVGQFGIVDHEPVDRGPNAGVFHGRGPAEERAELFLVAEGTTPAGEDFAAHVVSGIGQAWANLDMSLTGSLRRVFNDAAGNVRDWNERSISQHRVNLGLSCFARKGDHTVVAQAGPTLALHLHGNEVTLHMPDAEHAAPIGLEGPVEPQLVRLQFDPGDRLLLLSSAALDAIDEEVLSGILALPGVRALQDLYRRLRHLRDMTVLLIEAPPAPPVALQEEHSAGEDERIIGQNENGDRHLQARRALQPTLFVEALHGRGGRRLAAAQSRVSHVPERAAIPAPRFADASMDVAPLQRVVGDTRLHGLAAAQRERASASNLAATSAAAVTATVHARPTWRDHHHDDDRPQNTTFDSVASPSASFARSLVRERTNPRPDPGGSEAPLAADMVAMRRRRRTTMRPHDDADEEQQPAEYVAAPLVRPRNNMGGRWRANGTLSRRSVAAAQAPSTRFVVGIGLVLLLGLVAFLAVPKALNSDNDSRVAQLLESAERQLAAARVQEDPGLKRSGLTEAKALVLEAEQVGGTTTNTQALLNDVGSAISELDAIREPARVELIGSLESYGDSPVTPADISIGSGSAYLLDTTAGQVIAQPLSGGSATTVYRVDNELGQGRPTALTIYRSALDPDGGRLLISDAGGALWSYSPDDGVVQRVELNLPSGTRLTDIASYNGELYVLDADAGTVYRMTGIDGSFPYEPQIVQSSDDLKGAVRMHVDDEVITSTTAGSLQRYSGELVLELSQAGIDKRLTQPAAPWSMEDAHLAIADPANDRVVVFRRDGTFVRQYRHASFTDLTTLAMRDGAGYVFAGGKLLRVTWEE